MTPRGTFGVTGGWNGAVLLADGRVFVVPHNSTTARIFDPATETLTTPGGTILGNYACRRGAAARWTVLCIPHNAGGSTIRDQYR